ncbi:MAG: hypothetical protein QOC55_1494 [Thermoleophilaceae bacterium]|nr:hypothetical protein [Thermoleophilaceae bacterium]
MGRRGLTALAVAAVALAGCGPTPPQAPGPEAHQLNLSLSAISGACGHAAEIQAFENGARDMKVTERQAEGALPPLARIYKRNPDWVFQGKHVSQLVQMSSSYLDECGLHVAAKRLRAITSAK